MATNKLIAPSSIFHFLAQSLNHILKKIAFFTLAIILILFCTKAIPWGVKLDSPESFHFYSHLDDDSKNKLCRHKKTLFNNEWVVSDIKHPSSFSYQSHSTIEFTHIALLTREQEPHEDKGAVAALDQLSIEENPSNPENDSDGSRSSTYEHQDKDRPCEQPLKVNHKTPFRLGGQDKIVAQGNSLFIFYCKQNTLQQLEMFEGGNIEVTQTIVDLDPARDISFHPRMNIFTETMQTYDSDEDSEKCITPEFDAFRYAFLAPPPHRDGHHRPILISFDNFLSCYHWSKASNTIKPTCTHQFENIRTLTLSPDGTTVAVTDKNLIWLFDIDTNSKLKEAVRDATQISSCEKCHESVIMGIVFNPVKQDCFVSQHRCECNPVSESDQWSRIWFIDRTTKSIKHLGDLMAVKRVKKHSHYTADVEKLTTAYFSPDGKWYVYHGKKTINFYYFDSIPDPLSGQETVKLVNEVFFQQKQRNFCHATFRPDSDRVIIYFKEKKTGQYDNKKLEELSPKYYLLSPETGEVTPGKFNSIGKKQERMIDLSGHHSEILFLTKKRSNDKTRKTTVAPKQSEWKTWSYQNPVINQ